MCTHAHTHTHTHILRQEGPRKLRAPNLASSSLLLEVLAGPAGPVKPLFLYTLAPWHHAAIHVASSTCQRASHPHQGAHFWFPQFWARLWSSLCHPCKLISCSVDPFQSYELNGHASKNTTGFTNREFTVCVCVCACMCGVYFAMTHMGLPPTVAIPVTVAGHATGILHEYFLQTWTVPGIYEWPLWSRYPRPWNTLELLCPYEVQGNPKPQDLAQTPTSSAFTGWAGTQWGIPKLRDLGIPRNPHMFPELWLGSASAWGHCCCPCPGEHKGLQDTRARNALFFLLSFPRFSASSIPRISHFTA